MITNVLPRFYESQCSYFCQNSCQQILIILDWCRCHTARAI